MRTAGVDVWVVHLPSPRPLFLSSDEQARASRFHSEKQGRHWSHTRSALRQILGEHLSVPPLELVFTLNPHGKPLVEGVEFNLSHSADYAMVAVSRDAPVGIDIERFRPHTELAPLLARLGESDLPVDARELHQRWTRREAASKAAGGALFDALDPRVRVMDLPAPEDHFASVAALGAEPVLRQCGSR